MLSEVRWAGYTLGGSHPGLHVINVRVPDQLDSAFSAATQQKVSAMPVSVPDPTPNKSESRLHAVLFNPT
jgi:hypothetical protein